MIWIIKHQGEHGRCDSGDVSLEGIKPLHMQDHGLTEIEARAAGEQGAANGNIINIAVNRCARRGFKLRLNGNTDAKMLSPLPSSVIATIGYRHFSISFLDSNRA